jgi:hypothetical protein
MTIIVETHRPPRSATSLSIESRPSSSCDSGLGISELTFALLLEQPFGGFS